MKRIQTDFICTMKAAIYPVIRICTGCLLILISASLLRAQTVTTFTGTGGYGNTDGDPSTATFKSPRHMVMDPQGNIYITDADAYTVRKIDQSGTVTTIAGNTTAGNADGQGTAASFKNPLGIVRDAAGNLFVADAGNHTIRKIDPSGMVTTFAGSGAAGYADGQGTTASFNTPSSLAIDASGNIYVTDMNNHRIRKITPSAMVTTYAGTGVYGNADGAALSATFSYPLAMEINKTGELFIGSGYSIRKISTAGTVSTFAGNPTVYGETDATGTAARFTDIADFTFDNHGNIFVATFHSYKIRQVTPAGVVTTLAGSTHGNGDGPAASATFGFPSGILFDGYSNIYVSDVDYRNVRKINIPLSAPCQTIVTNTNDAGPGSLRACLECANITPGPDQISFAIAGTGPQTILLLSGLPPVTETIGINGFTQSGENNYNIILDGAGSGFANGLTLGDNTLDPTLYSVNNSMIRGLVFKNFGQGINFAFPNVQNTTIEKCQFLSCSNGIYFNSTASNITVAQSVFDNIPNTVFSYYNISTSVLKYNKINNCGTVINSYSADQLTIDHNTISNSVNQSFYLNNFRNGAVRYNNIYSSKTGIACQDCQNALIENNLLGADSTGAMAGNASNGIELLNYGAGTSCTVKNNKILNNTGSGIYIQNNNTTIIYVLGNAIGTDGSAADFGNTKHGIEINPNSGYVNIGDGTLAGENRISNNDLNGINFDYGGTFQAANVNVYRTLIYNNTGKSIYLGSYPGYQNNNNKITPYITKMSYAGGIQTLTVQTDPTDLRVDIFKGDTTIQNMLQFIQPSGVSKTNGVWTITFPAATANDYYTVTATGTTNNTSEVGYALPKATVVINTNDSGYGSLRNAILAANILSDTSYITFDIPGPAPHIIKPVDYYPFLKYSTVIDGGNKNDIVVDGSLKNHTNAGITIGDNSSSVPVFEKYSIVRNITVRGFYHGVHVLAFHKILFENVICTNNTDAGFYLPQTSHTSILDKCESSGSTYGVFQWQGDTLIIQNSYIHHNTQYGVGSGGSNTYQYIHVSGNTISYNQDGITASMGGGLMGVYNNFIFGNINYGINNGRGEIRNIKGNVIGLDSTLTQKRPNKSGISLDFTWEVFIDSNIISGNTEYGITNSRCTMHVTRNYIGTNPTGDKLGNGLIGVYGAYAGTTYIGGSTIDSANVIGNNGDHGIYTQYGWIKNNYIGVTKDFKEIGNTSSGAKIWMASFPVEGNYIGNNLESGIEGLFYGGVIKNNKIGGDGTHDFGNKKWGIKDYRSSTLVDNMIVNNDSGAVKVTSTQGKISRNVFTNSPYAIYFDNTSANGNKQAAVFTGQLASAASVTLSGTGTDTDTIEIFTSSATPETALSYVGYVVVNGGVWQYIIPRGAGYALKDNYYVTTASSTTNNTSRLSAPYKVPLKLYSTNLNVLPAQAGICAGSSLTLDAVIEDVSYSWSKAGTVISTSKQPVVTEGGDYILSVQDAFGNTAGDTVHVIENQLPLTADFLMSSEAGIEDKVVAVDISFSKPDSLVWDWDGATAVWDDNKYLLTFPSVGEYTVKLTSYLHLCIKSTQHTITVKPGKMSPSDDGILYPYTIKNVTGGPNPTDGILTVKAELANKDVITIKVHDIQGALLYSFTSPDMAFTHLHDIHFTPFSRGHYLVKVQSGNDERLLRIIKQ